MNSVVIDVRERDEFDAEHVANSVHIPLSEFCTRAPSLLRTLSDKTVILMCRSGKRASLAESEAKKFCQGAKIEVYSGGILEWKKQGNPTVMLRRSHLPILRQVQLIAGTLILVSSLLGYFVDPYFIFIASFAGFGLILAGATGFCGMAEILVRMPWNVSRPNVQRELCQATASCASSLTPVTKSIVENSK